MGFTLENAYFEINNVEKFLSTEHVVRRNNDEEGNRVLRRKVIQISDLSGPILRFGHKLSTEEKNWIVDDIKRFARENDIPLPESA